jgi:hypothetical protein
MQGSRWQHFIRNILNLALLLSNSEAVSSVNALDDGNVDSLVLKCSFLDGPNGSDGSNMEIIQEFACFIVCSKEMLDKNVISMVV